MFAWLVYRFKFFTQLSVVAKGYITSWQDDFEVEAILDHMEDDEEVSSYIYISCGIISLTSFLIK